MKKSPHLAYLGLAVLSAASVVGLSACSAKKDLPATQIAAKVNRSEISVHQINYMLQRQPGIKPEQLEGASRRTLDALIDQEIAVQAATAQKLDRDPSVMMALESARRDVLTRAYTDKLTEQVVAPSAEDVKRYYNSQPALFAQRRLYTLIDTAVEATEKQQQALAAQLGNTRGAADVANVLRHEGLRFGTRQSTVGAEALPMPAVETMSRLREGQSLLLPGPAQAHVLTIVSVESAPLDEGAAKPSIESFLNAQRKRELVERELKALRGVARIEYQGKFADTAASSPAASASASPALALSQVPVNLK